jgi:UDP-glucose 4-epimerase
MKILVTGGDGYVGRHLCRFLSGNHEVHILDRLVFGRDRNSYYKDSNLFVHDLDICDFQKVEELIWNIDPEVIFHLAAVHFIPQCEKYPDEAVTTNVTGTVSLLRALKRGSRLIFVSSAAVYAPDGNPHREDAAALGPCDIYGLTKLHGEQYVQYFGRRKKLETSIVRLFNVIGPGETNPHVLPVIMSQLLKGQRVIRLGNIHTRRDYIFTRDTAEGLAAIGLREVGSAGGEETLNLGTCTHYSVAELVGMLSEIIGEEILIEIDPRRVRETDRPILCADMTRTKRLTGWEPRFSMRSALEETWKDPDFRISGFEEILQ